MIKKRILAMAMACAVMVSGNHYIVLADAQECYYKNEKGVEFTKEEFQKINKYFDENTINQMSESMAEPLKKNEIVKTVEDVAYFEVIEKMDKDGNVVDVEEHEIGALEAMQKMVSRKVATYGLNENSEYKTSMKRITLHGWKAGASVNYATITNEWFDKLPKVRSFDVIGLRIGADAMAGLRLGTDSVIATQVWDGNTINYDPFGDHVRILTKGVGVYTKGLYVKLTLDI